MGQKVSNFMADVAKTAAKAGTSFVLGKVPIIGTPVANWINSKYAHGGMVRLKADGGPVVPPEATASGLPVKPVNTAAQLISVIKKFPDLAQKSGLSVAEVKEAVKGPDTKKRGGRKVHRRSPSDVGRHHHIPAAYKRGGQVYEHLMKVAATPSVF